MHIVGELKDHRMVEEILRGLKKIGIEAESHYNSEHEIYIITLPSDENLAQARDFYRVRLGFKKPIGVDPEWVKIKTLPRGEATFIMIIISVVVYLLSFSNMGEGLYNSLYIGKVDSSLFNEILHGQIWRLITPIFVHLSILHILFNMLWFKDLGYLIEYNFGKNFLLIFVLVSGLFSNLLQYLVSGPQFGGMSGVLYAMLAFIWVHKKIKNDFEYSLPRFDIGMMIGWFFVCLTGMLGPIANTAHGGGIVVGILAAVALNFKWEKMRFKFFSLALFFLIFTLAVEGYKLKGRYYFLLWLQ
ncbi:MAG: rhomboid family intramembrane serine protease [Bacteriovorax sp.]|nr:rhomboid family intramembrane serine protease [Bacteriovorax sp.]